jgi:hypothetical protein
MKELGYELVNAVERIIELIAKAAEHVKFVSKYIGEKLELKEGRGVRKMPRIEEKEKQETIKEYVEVPIDVSLVNSKLNLVLEKLDLIIETFNKK